MRFAKVAETMERLERTSKQTEMIDLLSELFKEATDENIAHVCYYLLGQIAAGYKDLTLGVGEKTIQQAIALASAKDVDKVEDRTVALGDLGDVAEEMVKQDENPYSEFFEAEGELTVEDVGRALKMIAAASGSGSQETKTKTLAALFAEADDLERRYLGRLAAGTMRLGVGDMTVLDGLAVAFLGSKDKRDPLERAYNMCSDVGHVAEVLVRSGLDGVKRIRIAMNRPLRPMLAQRVSKLSQIKEKIASEEIAAEEKYDGQRIQAHKNGDDVKLFSRRLEDITYQYPDIAENVRKHVEAEKAILDGEAVAYNFEEDTYYPFQKLMHRRRKYKVEEYAQEVPVKYMVFDLLYLVGSSYLAQPYPERREAVEDVVKDRKYIASAGRVVSASLDEIEDFFQDCLARNLEGIICKSCAEDATYEAGAREWAWIKWKPSYATKLHDTFDLVVVGAYAGQGSRAGMYGSLLCGAYNEEKDVFQTVCKLGSGFSDEELQNLPDKFEDLRVDKRPARVQATDDVEPDHWFAPQIVAEVLASEITQSPVHTCAQEQLGKGLALRFPRFQRWRSEKAADQATHTSEVRQMYESST